MGKWEVIINLLISKNIISINNNNNNIYLSVWYIYILYICICIHMFKNINILFYWENEFIIVALIENKMKFLNI